MSNNLQFLIKKQLQVFIFFLLISGVSAAHTQEHELDEVFVSITLEDALITDILSAIEVQTSYSFVYDQEVSQNEYRFSMNVQHKSLNEVLDTIASQADLSFKKLNRTITVVKAIPAPFQQRVQGKVIDKDGIPLPGVTIQLKDTSIGTITDFEGEFSLTTSDPEGVLIFSFIGFRSQEQDINSQTDFLITMEEDLQSLEEVVVVGYGTQKKANLTGAVSVINMEDRVADRPLTNTAEALQGAAPGLEVLSNSGQPGAKGLNLQIRGFESINGGSPLVLVDNVPMDIGDINPRDIETVTILKDAAAASIYGARAAFGVILITTKKGEREQPITFNYSSNFTFSKASVLPVKASPLQHVQALADFGNEYAWTGQHISTWLSLLNQYEQNPSAYPEGSTIIDGTNYPLVDQDLYGKFFDRGFEHIHNLSFSGGTEKSSYRVSVGYNDADGIMVTDKDSYQKINVNAFLNTDLLDNLTASVNVFYKNDTQKTPGNFGNIIGRAVNLSSFAPTGTGFTPEGEELPYLTSNNILKYEPAQENSGDAIRLYGKLEYEPIKNLTISGEYTFNKTSTSAREVAVRNRYLSADTYDLDYLNNESFYRRSNDTRNYHAFNLYANYNQSIGSHNFNLMLGTNQEINEYEFFNVRRADIISPDVPAISTSTGIISANDSFSEFAISGYFGRFNYNYKEKYLLEANARYDGSSRFPANHRFGFFPSVSAGWVLSEEDFMSSIKNSVSHLKVRGSWGEIGNQVTGSDYPYIPGMSPYDAEWIDPNTNLRYLSLRSPSLVSNNFTWETVRTTNLGVDIGLFSGRFKGSFDLFQRKTIDMLAPGSELPAVVGASAPLQNVADLETEGWDLELSWRDNIKDFNYSLGLNLSDNRTFITKFKNEAGLLSDYYVGQEIGELWGYVTHGYFTVDDFEPGTLNDDLTGGVLKEGIAAFEGYQDRQNPGDIRFVDLDGDGVITDGDNTLENPGDRTIIGNQGNRRYQFGITGSASYKNFDFSFFLQGVGKRDRWINTALFWPYRSQFQEIFANQLDYWTPENTEAYYPRYYPESSGNTDISRNRQSKYLLDGSYLRIKNITLGYSLPASFINSLNITRARVFFSGENLYTFDHLPKGLNAEVQNITSGGYYPFLKKFSFGLNISF